MEKKLPLLTVMFLKDVLHMFSNSVLILEYDKEL